ncbi:hypothetical protein B0I72DRAFT_101449 [Yarrowia lipolytica]|jgi:hypothetical protein|uniref:YALI0B13200p n=2 Tax=Yarrowia lipolytica TaxID=4952 RepID=Q6CET1_YARLI|nr:YALI0B13200p [Yarrowia lipolytica CLIB122]AOW01637.1 hypothetical protein YALI1_B17569g [Yarrowia lipolytica]KAB8279887.1 hypothetical protein BKA91DRAFT_119029 [Yarrowia lipolytica]KAE8175191.1 hypothetical protein BKA90DRAFT_133006 [Yarrowia lipolytica]KAJ8052442.1 hypothetical protein LXG23DRAFT_50464 [Yarrowia lipolytica]QNP97170.1 Hypothetical protein YALI2_C00823g [Yarrowia lipolytica]|eukprot:XP_500831.1 YALI0B13200p [Yarrowia lipolytica CLIB122]
MSEKVKIEAKPVEIRAGSSAPSPAGSAGSPPAPRMKIAPKLELKPSARGGLLDGPVQQIVTSKEWVLPPRPKPGRKPSSDTPPSKRKAQNRAAQRAFRERRAQRVSELEDKLQEVESERDAQENVLKDALKDVSSENQLLRESLEALRREVMSIKEQRTPTGSTPGQSPGVPPTQQAPPPPHQAQGPPMSAGLPPPTGRGPPPSQQSYYPSYSPYHMPNYSPHQVTSPMATMEPTSPFPGTHHRNSFGSFSFQSYGPYSPRYEYSNPASPSEHTTVATSVGDPSIETLDRVLETKMSTSKAEPRVQETSNTGVAAAAPTSTSVSVASLTNETTKKCTPATSGPSTSGGHEVDPDCIICTKEECACAAIGQQKAVMGHSNDDELDFTTFKPQAAVPLKRKSLEMEMDFTAAFKTRNPFKKRKDSCGFCTDGTPCLCEDAAAESVAESKKSLKLPPLGMPLSPAASAASPDAFSSGIGSPWDQEGERERADRSEKHSKRSETKVSDNPGCTGNPGTCMQCQSDPMSTLFCTTVASRKQSATRSTLPEIERERVDTPPPKQLAPIKTLSPAVSISSSGYSPSTQVGGTYIPCSAAYQTLSRHKDFNRVDLGTLIGKLNTRGTQVEVSSVANVLRELDRKFYE